MKQLQDLLEKLIAEHQVPGASVAVLDGGTVAEAAAGVVNLDTGVEVTTGTLFQIGSISKVYTATLVMQLVDEGKVNLDEPVRTYLPEFVLADERAAKAVTVRQLLCHTSGIDGDHFLDTGRGDDCVAEYVASCVTLPQVAPPGTLFSYCNAGFVVAGRIVEKLTGRTWDEALRERLLGPLATERTVTLPEEAILHRAAVGHTDTSNSGRLTRAAAWMLPRSVGPAGLIVSTPAEVLSFATLHLDGGRSVVSGTSVARMQEQQVSTPDPTMSAGRGLGWTIYEWGGRRVIGHDGGTIGQLAFLRIVPDARFAVCLLTNGITGRDLYKDLFTRLFDRLGITPPSAPQASVPVDIDPSRYAGAYERVNVRTVIEAQDGGLVASVDYEGSLADISAPIRRRPLEPVDESRFLMRMPHSDEPTVFVFLDFDASGRPGYLHTGGRAARRTAN